MITKTQFEESVENFLLEKHFRLEIATKYLYAYEVMTKGFSWSFKCSWGNGILSTVTLYRNAKLILKLDSPTVDQIKLSLITYFYDDKTKLKIFEEFYDLNS